jgi:hypothetical protein
VQLLSSENLEKSETKDAQVLESDDSQAFANKAEPKITPPAQYVGDISADSSIPFSIPLNQQDALKPGLNTVTLKVVYADNLKNFHEMIWEGQVNFEKKANPDDSERARRSSFLDGDQAMITPIIVVAAIAAAVIVLKKRTAKNKIDTSQTKFENDIESLLDEHSKEKKDEK